jgi:hypothetical protein
MRARVTSNANVVAREWMARSRRVMPAYRQAATRFGKEWLDQAHKYTMRRYASLAELRRMGHPYAKRIWKPRGGKARFQKGQSGLPAPAYYINRQSGTVNRSWQRRVQTEANVIAIYLWNEAAWFIHLHFGTKFMIARPMMATAAKVQRKKLDELLAAARRRIWRGGA